MAASSPLAPPARPLCAPPYLPSSAMDPRRFKVEESTAENMASSPDQWRRHEQRRTHADESEGDWRRSAPHSYSAPTPPNHGLRYGSRFPYNVQDERERNDARNELRRRYQEEDSACLYQRQQNDNDETLPCSDSAVQFLLDEQRRLGRGRHDMSRRGPMPSLDRMLERAQPDPYRAQGVRYQSAVHPDEKYVHEGNRERYFDRVPASYDREASLSAIERLTERSSLDYSPSRTSRLSGDRFQSAYTDRSHGVRLHPTVAQLRYDSSRASSDSPLYHSRASAATWSSPASVVSSSTNSPTTRERSAHAAGEEPYNAETPPKKKKKRKTRLCTKPGCDKLVVDHGVCIRHGGGKRCNVKGCECRAQNKGLCWKHGGYTICQIDGCDKRAKSRGMCWSHGGGTQCKTDGCEKIAVSRGRCWAHGGGKRCKLPQCQKPAALRMDNFCSEHYAAHRAAVASGAVVQHDSHTQARYEQWQ